MIATQEDVQFSITWLNNTTEDFSLAWPGAEAILLEPNVPSAAYSIELSNMELPLTVEGDDEIRLRWTQNGSNYDISQNFGEGWQAISGKFPVSKENYTIYFVRNDDGILIVGTIDIEIELPS